MITLPKKDFVDLKYKHHCRKTIMRNGIEAQQTQITSVNQVENIINQLEQT